MVRSMGSIINHIRFYLLELPKFTIKNLNNNARLIYNPSKRYLDRIKIWNFSYWPIDVRWWVYISIWNYCSIAEGVIFIWIDHQMKYVSQHGFPFNGTLYDKLLNPIYTGPYKINKNLFNNIKPTTDKWPIIVDDDVRIWTWAKIMSWVHIWQWAVIAAWAIVTKDIPPYAIAWWVPAKVIKYRFSEDKIQKLLQIDYSNTSVEKFREIYPEIMKEDFDIDYILKKLKQE